MDEEEEVLPGPQAGEQADGEEEENTGIDLDELIKDSLLLNVCITNPRK